jgi:hypothetical protein
MMRESQLPKLIVEVGYTQVDPSSRRLQWCVGSSAVKIKHMAKILLDSLVFLDAVCE